MANNEIDIRTYFDAKFESLKEYFDVKFKNMDEKFDTLKIDNKAEHISIKDAIDKHETRLSSLENCDGKDAKTFIQMVKETTAKWIIPVALLLIVYAFSSGLITRLLGANV
jgi:hypothetical protein